MRIQGSLEKLVSYFGEFFGKYYAFGNSWLEIVAFITVLLAVLRRDVAAILAMEKGERSAVVCIAAGVKAFVMAWVASVMVAFIVYIAYNFFRAASWA